jgi:hypothetical protein
MRELVFQHYQATVGSEEALKLTEQYIQSWIGAQWKREA